MCLTAMRHQANKPNASISELTHHKKANEYWLQSDAVKFCTLQDRGIKRKGDDGGVHYYAFHSLVAVCFPNRITHNSDGFELV